MSNENEMPTGVAPDGSVVFKPKFAIDDVVRLVAIKPGTSIESYLGSEGRVVDKHPELPLYTVELDVGRANVDRAGQLGPRFIVREDHLDPEVTEKMIEAAVNAFAEYEASLPADGETGVSNMSDELARIVYRAMRAARFER